MMNLKENITRINQIIQLLNEDINSINFSVVEDNNVNFDGIIYKAKYGLIKIPILKIVKKNDKFVDITIEKPPFYTDETIPMSFEKILNLKRQKDSGAKELSFSTPEPDSKTIKLIPIIKNHAKR